MGRGEAQIVYRCLRLKALCELRCLVASDSMVSPVQQGNSGNGTAKRRHEAGMTGQAAVQVGVPK
jgi:hypothetical protein